MSGTSTTETRLFFTPPPALGDCLDTLTITYLHHVRQDAVNNHERYV